MYFKKEQNRDIIFGKESNIIIKIAKNNKGLTQNTNEFVLNKKCPDLTAKVLSFSGEYLITEWVGKTLPNLWYIQIHTPYDFSFKKLSKKDKEWWNIFNGLCESANGLIDDIKIGYTKDKRMVASDYGIIIPQLNGEVEYGNKATDWTPAPEDLKPDVIWEKGYYTNYGYTVIYREHGKRKKAEFVNEKEAYECFGR